MNSRYFLLAISCASCKSHIEKVFAKYPDIEYSVNVVEKILTVKADEEKYSNDFIIELVKEAGYSAEEY
ncbi:cation transporter [Candidatus Mycoplasma pogonae]